MLLSDGTHLKGNRLRAHKPRDVLPSCLQSLLLAPLEKELCEEVEKRVSEARKPPNHAIIAHDIKKESNGPAATKVFSLSGISMLSFAQLKNTCRRSSARTLVHAISSPLFSHINQGVLENEIVNLID